MIKRTKDSVQYEHPAKIPQNNCGVCEHYCGYNLCAKVMGEVQPEDWCKLWEHE